MIPKTLFGPLSEKTLRTPINSLTCCQGIDAQLLADSRASAWVLCRHRPSALRVKIIAKQRRATCTPQNFLIYQAG